PDEFDPKQVAPFVWFLWVHRYPQSPLWLAVPLSLVLAVFLLGRLIILRRRGRLPWSTLSEAALPLGWLLFYWMQIPFCTKQPGVIVEVSHHVFEQGRAVPRA